MEGGSGMNNWYMVTLVGEDKAGIVAAISKALFEGGCNLGEASMMRLGGNFTVMMMVNTKVDQDQLSQLLDPVAQSLKLKLHIDKIQARLHQHRVPDVRISVFCADRAGIVAQATAMLADAGLDILDLESDVGGTSDKPIFVMNIEGVAQRGIDVLQKAASLIEQKGIEITVAPVELLVG